MPRLMNRNPSYRRHKASGQAVVTLGGQDVYLGPHGTAASKREYDRVVGEWLARGRQLRAARPTRAAWPTSSRATGTSPRATTRARSAARNSARSGCALGVLRRLYGDTLAARLRAARAADRPRGDDQAGVEPHLRERAGRAHQAVLQVGGESGADPARRVPRAASGSGPAPRARPTPARRSRSSRCPTSGSRRPSRTSPARLRG